MLSAHPQVSVNGILRSVRKTDENENQVQIQTEKSN